MTLTYFACKVSQIALIGTKFKLALWRPHLNIYQCGNWYLNTFRKKITENFEKSKARTTNRKNSQNKIFVNGTYVGPHMYHIWSIHLDLWGHGCKKWVWPSFGCKISKNVSIAIKLNLGMSCHIINVYTKVQIDIKQHFEKIKLGKHGRRDGRRDRPTDISTA